MPIIPSTPSARLSSAVEQEDRGRTELFIENVSKSFGAQQALQNVTLRLKRGEKHALLGSNGAGKSTLAWLLAGRFKHYGGSFSTGGKRVALTSRRDSRKIGIEIVTQEPALASALTIGENLFLGPDRGSAGTDVRSRRTWGERFAESFFRKLGLDLDMADRAGALPLSERQIVDLMRAAIQSPKFLVIDEPPLLSDPKYESVFRDLECTPKVRHGKLGTVL